jgi:hypothetical protein
MLNHFSKVKSKKVKFCLIISLFIIYSCIEPFRPGLSKYDQETHLVVESTITDQPGPFKVRLTISGSVYTGLDTLKFDPITGAIVDITDDKGNNFPLYYVEKGWYETIDKCLYGIPGNIYTLHITTEDRSQYESSPQLMLDVPSIDSVFYKEVQQTHIEGENVSMENWLNILLNTHAMSDGIQYLKWEFEETWEFEMPSYIVVNHGGGEGAIPPSIETVNIDDERRHCWVTERSKNILVESTIGKQDNKISHFLLQSIGPEGDKLNIRYSMLVKQYSINKELYDYFKILKEVNEATGGIYSKIPGKVTGNITCLNSGEKALGYFFVSSVSSKLIFIDHNDTKLERGSGYPNCGWTTAPPPPGIVFPVYGTYIDKDGYTMEVYSDKNYCTDCRVRGTKVKPDYWQ